MNSVLKGVLLAASAVVMTACGGGGGGDTGQPAVVQGGTTVVSNSLPTPTAALTPDLVTMLAKLGVLTDRLMTAHDDVHVSFAANFLQGFSITSGGSSGPSVVNCSALAPGGTGSFTSTVTRAGIYPGLRTGDRVRLVFNNCQSSGTNLSGELLLVARADFGSLSPQAFVLQFSMTETGFSISDSGFASKSTGTTNVVYDRSNAQAYRYNALSIGYLVDFSGGGAPLQLGGGNAVRNASFTATTTTADSLGLFSVTAKPNPELVFFRETPQLLSGPAGQNPTSGAILLSKLPAAPAQAKIAVRVQGAIATITADTDGNGSDDLTQNIAFSQLLQ